ncbi:MAG TPA: hypothetical protein VKD28_02945 [Gemmatimonadales bacterium]|nr:hypothetical protein [Gemmatimonadales bacterium]
MSAPASWWRLVFATFAFVLWAHPSLLGLPCAALLMIAPTGSGVDPASMRVRPPPLLAVAIAALSLALLWLTAISGGRLGAVLSAYIVLVTAAFVALVLLRSDTVLKQAFRSLLLGGLATALLIQLVWGIDGWGEIGWEVTREVSFAMRWIVKFSPPEWIDATFALYEPTVRFMSLTWPGMLALQTLAGLALAWQLHLRLTSLPLGAPLARFRDFAIGDAWVWGIVAWIAVLILPVSGALQVAGTNLGLVAGALYVLRGAAIVVTFAEVFGISSALLVVIAAAAAALAVPLLFLLPGLCTLGITDTWYQYRQRLAAARERLRTDRSNTK